MVAWGVAIGFSYMVAETLGKFQTEVSTPMPYSLPRAEPFEVSSLKGVGHYCLI